MVTVGSSLRYVIQRWTIIKALMIEIKYKNSLDVLRNFP